jgi:hypothetical protein
MPNNAGLSGQNYFDQSVFNARIPKEGPKALSLLCPFTASNTSFVVDFSITMTQGFISMIQGVFVDNSANPDILQIQQSSLGINIQFPANSQGYIPLLVPNPATLTVASLGQVSVYMVFLNVPVPALIWSTETGGGGSDVTIVSSPTFGAVTPGVAGTKSDLVGAIYESGGVTLTNGQQAALQLDSAGNLKVNVEAGGGGGSVSITTAPTYGAVSPGTAATDSELVGGIYESGGVTLTNGQQAAVQMDSVGNVKVTDYVSGSITTNQTTVGSGSASHLISAGTQHGALIINTSATVTVYLGGTSGVTSSTGFPLPPGATFNADKFNGDIYGITASSTALVGAVAFA